MFKDYCYCIYYRSNGFFNKMRRKYDKIHNIEIIKFLYYNYNYIHYNIENTDIIDFIANKKDHININDFMILTFKDNNIDMFEYLKKKYNYIIFELFDYYICYLKGTFNPKFSEYLYLQDRKKYSNKFIDLIINYNFPDELLFKYYDDNIHYDCIFNFKTITKEKFDFLINKKNIKYLYLIKHCVIVNNLFNYDISNLDKDEIYDIVNFIFNIRYNFYGYNFNYNVLEKYFIYQNYKLTNERLKELIERDYSYLIKYCSYNRNYYLKFLIEYKKEDLLKEEIKNNNLDIRDIVDILMKLKQNLIKDRWKWIKDFI